MREIKFRGKRLDDGEWVYGYYAHTTITDDPACIGDCRKHHLIIVDGSYFHVDPKTVGQYIGLRDKNGVEIFEGDIYRDGQGKNWVIRWVRIKARFELYAFEGTNNRGVAFYQLEDLTAHKASMGEKIGNIYDNPELLHNSPWSLREGDIDG